MGFNGVMYSLLEDNGLAEANNLRAVTIEKLAVFSSVCGCGIDMVPVPGMMFAEDLAGLALGDFCVGRATAQAFGSAGFADTDTND